MSNGFCKLCEIGSDSLSHVQAYLNFIIKQAAASEFHFDCIAACFPGNKIPRCFLCETSQRWITIEIPSCSDLLGFAFCIIISRHLPYSNHKQIVCKYYFENEKIIKTLGKFCFYQGNGEMISDHVYLIYKLGYCKAILKEIEERASNQCTNFNEKLVFEFSVEDIFPVWRQMDQMIKKCGVWPIYHSNISCLDNKEQSLDLGMGNKNKRCCVMDYQPAKKFKAFKLELELGTKS